MLWKDLCAFGVFNAGYIAYLELSPRMGGILIRPDSNGNKKVNLSSFWNFVKEPFNTKNPACQKLWELENLDLNYAVCAATFMGVYKGLSNSHLLTDVF